MDMVNNGDGHYGFTCKLEFNFIAIAIKKGGRNLHYNLIKNNNVK
jgi:hypothetical protein